MSWTRRQRWLGSLAVCAVLAGAFAAAWRLRCGGETVLFVVRHADRQGRDDALSASGAQRALTLAHVLEKERLAAIYQSDTTRARETAAPLANRLNLTPVVYRATDVAALVGDIFADRRGQRVLVVGHSNTVPQIIAAAGGPALQDIAETEFDNLFVLRVCGCLRAASSLVHLQYGQPSP